MASPFFPAGMKTQTCSFEGAMTTTHCLECALTTQSNTFPVTRTPVSSEASNTDHSSMAEIKITTMIVATVVLYGLCIIRPAEPSALNEGLDALTKWLERGLGEFKEVGASKKYKRVGNRMEHRVEIFGTVQEDGQPRC
jgi:hypothetical protein